MLITFENFVSRIYIYLLIIHDTANYMHHTYSDDMGVVQNFLLPHDNHQWLIFIPEHLKHIFIAQTAVRLSGYQAANEAK